MIINKNFIGSRMNKSLDERLIPAGDYTDALNIRVSSSEDGEALSAENTKGNELLATPRYDGKDVADAVCIGAYEDGENEKIYWFLTSDVVDMILSYNTKSDSITYHVVSETVLNFDERYLINGINLIDDLLFFTDNYNQPRRINVLSSYPEPIGGVDQITEDDISVIVKPPVDAPVLTLSKKAKKDNYMEEKFIRFSYRYKYKDGEYSALSEFSDLAFTPGQFRFDYGSYDMIGMRNNINSVNVDFFTGPSDVIGIDLCFKLSNTNVINVIEKYDKSEMGWGDNDNVSVEFTNQKIYTTLPESELLRLYDNVPKKAKAQTTIGNRIMYGNYYDGHDVDTIIDYSIELNTEDIGFNPLVESRDDGTDYTLETPNVTITNSRLDIDLTDIDMLEGGSLNIDFNIVHDSFGGNASFVDGSEVENNYQETFEFIFPRDYSDAQDLATDTDFLASIELTDPAGFPGTEDDGYSLSDLFFSSIVDHASGNWGISDGGITSSDQGFIVSHSGNTLSIQIPAVEFEDSTNPGTYAYEYFSNSSTTASITEQGNRQSLHSNRDYEVGIVYLDEYNRASTALVSNYNTVYVEPQYSINKNSITTTINSLAPSWAKRYRLVMKPSKGNYETVYVQNYYFDTSEGAWWLKLEGDNQTKFKNGDSLIVKKASDGPTTDVIKTKVLDLETKEKHFIDENNEVPPSSGVYMKVRPSNFTIAESEVEDIDFDSLTKKNGVGQAYPTYIEDPDNPGTYIDYSITSGSEVRIFFNNHRAGSGSGCGSRYFKFDRTFIATRDYDSLYDFIISENVDFNNPTNNPGPESSDDTTPSADFDESIGTALVVLSTYSIISGGYNAGEGVTGIQFVRNNTPGTSNYSSFLTFTQAGSKCNGRNYWLTVHIQVFNAGELLVFETIPEENTNEIYYESFKSYPITEDRHHTGDVQDQTNSDSCIVNLDMYNCFAFGNGVESFKIEDGLAQPGFNLGARVTAVSEQDYKEAHRYADITYSGVYNQETNLNKLNEFNLGLVNFKTLEQNFGPIEVLHARMSDILTLQEDKISYVLANGKNLFSDAQAGGAILSTPDVLGQQVPRIEEYGISNNPESFSNYGFDIFFTDSKRGAVINLKGSGKGDQLNVISSLGMRSWFRDRFIENTNKMHLGAYDPYMNEYVLSFTDNLIDVQEDNVDCGFSVAQQSSSTVATYNINLDDFTGDVDIDYDVTSGSLDILVTYDGTDVLDQVLTGTGTLTFSKDELNVNECVLVLTPTNATYEINFGCVQAQQLTVVRIVNNTDEMEDLSIHHEYLWEDNGSSSQVVTDSFTFGEGPVSLYETSTNFESQGGSPSEGATVTMRYKKLEGDLAEWDIDKFKYLVSDVLYQEGDIATLIPLLTEATPILSPETDVYEASFTYTNTSNNQYLYLVWDYIDQVSGTTVTATFDNSLGNERYSSQFGLSPLSVTSPGTPTRFGWTFTGWSPTLPTTITSDTTFTSQWSDNGVTYGSVVAVDDCNDADGVATSIVSVDETDAIIVGQNLYQTSGGDIVLLSSGTYRLSSGLTDGQNYVLSSITVSDYIIVIGTSGVIINIIQC